MKNSLKKKFIADSEKIVFDEKHRATIGYNMSKYYEAENSGLKKYADFEAARNLASEIKTDVVNNLGKYLTEFVDKFEKNGGIVHYAQNSSVANEIVFDIVKKYNAGYVVKSKSMATEEIGLNEFLEKKGIDVWETDLGEFIVQQAGEKPYHIVTPAMHKSLKDIAKLYHKKFGLPENAGADELTEFTRNFLREKFKNAKVGITGANFLIASEGAVAVTENEGNAFMSFSFPDVHIVIVGIEKLLPDLTSLSFFWQLLAYRGTGQSITAYNSLIYGSQRRNETDGPKQMHVILLDNNRLKVLKNKEKKEIFKCIRCGACFNYCPVYKNIGGYTYNTVYGGPVGSVLTPLLFGLKEYGHLSFACTLCGKCEEVCPVKIKLTDLMLSNRRDYVENYAQTIETMTIKGITFFTNSRKRMDFFGRNIKNMAIKLSSSKIYGKKRKLPQIQTSFAQIHKSDKKV